MATRQIFDQSGNVVATETIADPPLRTWLYPVEIRGLFTPEERAALFASTDPIVRDLLHWLGMVIDPVDVQSVNMQQGLGYLVMIDILTPERMAAISQGAA